MEIIQSRSDCEAMSETLRDNYHLYMVTLKPNFKSYIKKSINQSEFMINQYNVFMNKFSEWLKQVDVGIEYDSKNVCHIHAVLVSKRDVLKFMYDKFNISDLINFKKGIYVDFRTVDIQDLDKVIQYINKGNKTDEIMNYYRTTYGFI